MWILTVGQFLAFHLRRAGRWDLRGLTLTAGEAARLQGRSIHDDTVRTYLAWRRSTFLLLAGLALAGAILHVLNFLDLVALWPASWSAFGIGREIVRLGAVFALAATALVGALLWARPRPARAVTLAGWLVALLVPIVLAFFPLHWSFNFDALSLGESERLLDRLLRALEIPATAQTFAESARHGLAYLVDVLGAIWYGVLLLPSLLALIPGTLRSCVRVKLLAPASVVPGWFLITLVPFYVLLWLIVVMVVVNVRAGLLVLGSVVLMAGAPLAYLLQAGPLVRPLTATSARGILRVRLLFSTSVAGAFVLLAIFLFTKEYVIEEDHVRLVGLDEDTSLMMPWEVVSIGLDYLTRSLFTTAVVTDLFLQIHLSTCQRMRELVAADPESDHDRQIAALMRDLKRW